MDHVSTASALYKRRNVYINIIESCGVSLDRELCIVKVKNKLSLAVRPESVIEIVVLRILSY